MRRFLQWVENVTAQPQTTSIPPQAASQQQPTVAYGTPPAQQKPLDPQVGQATQRLHGIHDELRNLFATLRQKYNLFPNPQLKSSFERELLAGIDGIGRAHAVILPAAVGAQQE